MVVIVISIILVFFHRGRQAGGDWLGAAAATAAIVVLHYTWRSGEGFLPPGENENGLVRCGCTHSSRIDLIDKINKSRI